MSKLLPEKENKMQKVSKLLFFCINCVYYTCGKESPAYLPQAVKDSNPFQSAAKLTKRHLLFQSSKGTPGSSTAGRHPSFPPCHSHNGESYTVLSFQDILSCCKHHSPCSQLPYLTSSRTRKGLKASSKRRQGSLQGC